MVVAAVEDCPSLNRVIIDRQALAFNLRLCRQLAGGADVLAMVKADGYGHGMVECGRIFSEAGATALGVAEPEEGIRLRQSGCRLPVLVFTGILPETVEFLWVHRLTPVLLDTSLIQPLIQTARRRQRPIAVHVKVDAGMGRQGCQGVELAALIQQIHDCPEIELVGILAHLPCADEPDGSHSRELVRRFLSMLKPLAPCLPPGICLHVANSGGLFYGGDIAMDMVRLGIALYGYYPDGAAGRQRAVDTKLRPVMQFSSRLVQVRRVEAGQGLGYGHTYVTPEAATIGVMPVGYEDGYLRQLSNRARVLIRGRRLPIVGRISMNLTLVDISPLADVQPGEPVVLLGRQGQEEITADEIANWLGSISYEVLCLFGNRNRRIYRDLEEE